ncbi:MAG: hypothetical protein JO372_18145 [Solirubrobacterales bacterium]|nr:hypothetical protein [Solirubrobacterales bacterium]
MRTAADPELDRITGTADTTADRTRPRSVADGWSWRLSRSLTARQQGRLTVLAVVTGAGAGFGAVAFRT